MNNTRDVVNVISIIPNVNYFYLLMSDRVSNKRITTLYFLSSQMDNNEIFDAFSASGSAETKFSAGMDKHEEIKQENFDG